MLIKKHPISLLFFILLISGAGNIEGGTYFSEPSVSYVERSLPYNPADELIYAKWRLEVPLQAEKSIVAPIPQYRLPGGGVQYQFVSPKGVTTPNGYMNAKQMIKHGFIIRF